jgi:hypothetical protein
MKFKRIEYHTVHSHFDYDIPNEDIVNAWGSIERFRQIVSHFNADDWSDAPIGEPPTTEEEDLWHEFFENYNYDRDDDWFSDRKGGYEVSYEVVDDREDWEDDEDGYDSDEELFH